MDINAIDDKAAAAAFRRLVHHLQHRNDAANIDLMGLAGFCRNCLGDWLAEADPSLTKAAAREAVHGMPAAAWKATQPSATEEQLARMEASVARNATPSHEASLSSLVTLNLFQGPERQDTGGREGWPHPALDAETSSA